METETEIEDGIEGGPLFIETCLFVYVYLHCINVILNRYALVYGAGLYYS